MSPPVARGRGRRHALGIALAACLMLAGCAPAPSYDPALVAAVEDALSAARSAQLGLHLDRDGRILPTTNAALLGDMDESLLDTARELALTSTSTDRDADYRSAALEATRAAAEAIHAAEQGDPRDAAAALTTAVDALARLAETP